MNNQAYQEGYNYYWHGGQDCNCENGTIEWADWWEGWEAAVKEDKPPKQEQEDDDENTADAEGVKVFLGLVRGYYQATRKTGRHPLFSLYNAINLAKRAY